MVACQKAFIGHIQLAKPANTKTDDRRSSSGSSDRGMIYSRRTDRQTATASEKERKREREREIEAAVGLTYILVPCKGQYKNSHRLLLAA